MSLMDWFNYWLEDRDGRIPELQAAVDRDPSNEMAWWRLMWRLQNAGNLAGAALCKRRIDSLREARELTVRRHNGDVRTAGWRHRLVCKRR